MNRAVVAGAVVVDSRGAVLAAAHPDAAGVVSAVAEGAGAARAHPAAAAVVALGLLLQPRRERLAKGLDVDGLLKGMYLLAPATGAHPLKAQVLASGVAVPWALT